MTIHSGGEFQVVVDSIKGTLKGALSTAPGCIRVCYIGTSRSMYSSGAALGRSCAMQQGVSAVVAAPYCVSPGFCFAFSCIKADAVFRFPTFSGAFGKCVYITDPRYVQPEHHRNFSTGVNCSNCLHDTRYTLLLIAQPHEQRISVNMLCVTRHDRGYPRPDYYYYYYCPTRTTRSSRHCSSSGDQIVRFLRTELIFAAVVSPLYWESVSASSSST